MKKIASLLLVFFVPVALIAQFNWIRVDSLYQPLPSSVAVWMSRDSVEGKPGIAYAVVADLKDKHLLFTADTGNKRRLTPSGFFEKNNSPLVVVNTTFFSFTTHQNLNAVMIDGKLVAYNVHSLPGKGRDTLTWRHPIVGAIGISDKRKADVAWLYTDSASKIPLAIQVPVAAVKDSSSLFDRNSFYKMPGNADAAEWKMQTAVAGGPVVLQQGEIKISNNEELKFAGKAISDRHPRTAMGYTADQKLVILVVEGRNPGKAEGVTLAQEAALLQSLGCIEALNLDGGGSSCLLINGKETIRPSDKEGQRAVPGVFIISQRKK